MSDIEKQLQLVMNKTNDIEYGFVDNNQNIYPDTDENWDNSFQKNIFYNILNY